MIEYNSINKTTVLYIDWDFKMLQNVQVLFLDYMIWFIISILLKASFAL